MFTCSKQGVVRISRKIQSYETEESKRYYDIAMGMEEVQLATYSQLFKQLPSKEHLILTKNDISHQLLSLLQTVDSTIVLPNALIKKFSDDPNSFHLKKIEPSTVNFIEKIKGVQSLVNEFLGHYFVCRSELNFIQPLYNEKMDSYNKMKNNLARALEGKANAELQSYQMPGLVDSGDCVLNVSDKEKSHIDLVMEELFDRTSEIKRTQQVRQESEEAEEEETEEDE